MKTVISAHDRYQIECKHRYPLQQGRGGNSYEVGLYFFAPRSLGIDPRFYSKRQFYGDLQNYIRIETPSVSLTQFGEYEDSPLIRLRAILAATARKPTERTSLEYESEIKLFCCIFKSAVRDFILFIKQITNAGDRESLISKYAQAVQRIVAGYRALQPVIQAPGVGRHALDIYFFGDEYISLLVEDYTYSLIEAFSSTDKGPSLELQKHLMALIEGEVKYRQERGYPSIPEEKGENETLVFRRSVLKKYMATILFLDTQTKKEGFLLEQTLLGLAAGVAMLFATAVAFISQSLYGALTLPVFVALVLSYIFKDRIKDLLRLHLSRRASRRLFDHKIRVYDAARNVVGICRECFEFIESGKVPRNITELRDRDHITEIENGWLGEQIFSYRKRIRIQPRKVRRVFTQYEISAVTDIMRFNIQSFLRKMDDPKKELFVMDDDGYSRIKGARVYHLNLIIVLEHNKLLSCERYRIVLSRKGIKRIEHVNHMKTSSESGM